MTPCRSFCSLAALALALGGVACSEGTAPGPGEKVELGRDLRAFPAGEYEMEQAYESETQQAGEQPPQTTRLKQSLLFSLKFKPPGEGIADEGEATVTVLRAQEEMHAEKVSYDSEGKPTQGASDLVRPLKHLVGVTARAGVRFSKIPNRPQIEPFEGLDAAWRKFAAEGEEPDKEKGEKDGKRPRLDLPMLMRSYGDAMLNRMLAQGLEFLPMPPRPSAGSGRAEPVEARDPAAPKAAKAAVAVGETWKVTKKLSGLLGLPTDVEHTCTLTAAKDGAALITVTWAIKESKAEGGQDGKKRTYSIEEAGSSELTFHLASGLLTGLRSTVKRVEGVAEGEEPGKGVQRTSRAAETRSFSIRPKGE